MAGLTTERWRSLDFSQFRGSISAVRGALSVKNDELDLTVPTADVSVVLIGVGTKLSAGAMHRLLEDDVAVIFCDWKGVPYGGSFGWSDHSRVGARHRAQASLSEPKRKSTWARIVKAKILGQAAVLDYCSRPGGSLLRNLSKNVRSGDTSNVEGQAARSYWQYLWGDEGFKRQPGIRDQVLPSNSMLDYGYTILRGHAIRAVFSAGLSPTIGLFHHGRSNYFALADDIIEPFRPAIDACIASEFSGESIESPDIRRAIVEVAHSTFGQTGNSIPTEMTALAQRLGQLIEGDPQKLLVNVWSPIMTLGITDE
ncbi:type II CRISPR-associated endonuclease Cas1 [Arcanobacterium buesumense]|uniref:CRISPR-associated endonuclease Cas1 n=1 Tax=Arcanobacterium buesumense TaxID=2722751 RepID=A0A6H2ENB8_9ACTO|nr:type II CRISPR-associated endonuclease Cas1 [Arcanobacterium buesumense]QJC22567.1 type II CRISPR-associated endonuclease Cas1 [Arcanobacterium buesumense]